MGFAAELMSGFHEGVFTHTWYPHPVNQDSKEAEAIELTLWI